MRFRTTFKTSYFSYFYIHYSVLEIGKIAVPTGPTLYSPIVVAIKSVKQQLTPEVDEILAELRAASWVCSDETIARVNGKTNGSGVSE